MIFSYVALQRLFYQAKIDLHRLASLSEQEKHLHYLMEQCDPQDTGHMYSATFRYRRMLRENRQTTEEQLEENRSQQHWLAVCTKCASERSWNNVAYELKETFSTIALIDNMNLAENI